VNDWRIYLLPKAINYTKVRIHIHFSTKIGKRYVERIPKGIL